MNFEKTEEIFFSFMNKVFKQNEIVENIHKRYANNAAISSPSTSSMSTSSEDSSKLNLKFKPIEIGF